MAKTQADYPRCTDLTLKCDDGKDETILEKAKHLPEQATHAVEKAVDLGHQAGVPLPASRLDSEYLVRDIPSNGKLHRLQAVHAV